MKYIYKILNIQNNKVYIGQTNNFNRRKNEHFKHLKYKKHENKPLQEDYIRYGSFNFKIEIIEEVEDEKGLERETYWINYYGGINSQNVYNIESLDGRNIAFKKSISGKNAPFYNKKHTNETKEKMREAKKNKYIGRNNPNYGNHKLMGRNNPNYGKKMSDKQKDKLRKAKIKYKPQFVEYLRAEHNKGISFVELEKKLNISASTLGRLYNYGTTSPYIINQIKLNKV